MQIITKSVLILAMCSLLVLPLAAARAESGVNKDTAVSTVTAKYPGKVVKITNDKQFYHVRVLQKNGRVVTVKVDRKTGKIIK